MKIMIFLTAGFLVGANKKQQSPSQGEIEYDTKEARRKSHQNFAAAFHKFDPFHPDHFFRLFFSIIFFSSFFTCTLKKIFVNTNALFHFNLSQ